MKLYLTESQFQKLIIESFRFNWKKNKYMWINDKKSTNINTSMTKKDDDGKPSYNYTEKLLPNSGILSYNLFAIKTFYVTQALKHGKVKRYLPIIDKDDPKRKIKEYSLTPDESIDEFKNYTAKYVNKLLLLKNIDIDIILTPQSSSQFNKEITELIGKYYKNIRNKELVIKPNAFIKTPEKIEINHDLLKKNMETDVSKYINPTNIIDFQKEVSRRINDLYENINKWKIEKDIEPFIMKFRRANKWINNFLSKEKLNNEEKKSIENIQSGFQYFENYLSNKYGNLYLKTRYYNRKGELIPQEQVKSWQIKQISDAARTSLKNLFDLSSDLDTHYNYTDIKGKEISGVSKFIDQLKRNDKTILIFDDNLSSGSTLDDICVKLIEYGVNKKNIIPITFGITPRSVYNRNIVTKSK